jgi:NAD(P)-dependent dehydrogenase (short-subunit alcohol dehydrogenase family)
MRLQHKTALITGAGRGLGRAVALEFAREGASLCLMSRTEAELQQACREAEGLGAKCLAYPGDVSRQDEVAACVAKARQAFGGIDILVNDAAVIGPARFLEDAQGWRATLETNLFGASLCCAEVLPVMQAQGSGSIVNVSSGLARMAFPRFNAYCVSKAGLEQLTRCLAEEMRGSGVRINCIDPGVMDTSMQATIRGIDPEALGRDLWSRFQEMKTSHSLRDPGDVAKLVLYLASPESADITGQTLSMHDLPRGYV